MDGLNSCVDINGGSDQLTLESVTVNSVDSDESIKVHYVVPAAENVNVIPETPKIYRSTSRCNIKPNK